jgi:hypothetical protein
MAEAVTSPAEPVTERSPHAPRFAALIGGLVGMAIGALALAVVLIGNGSGGPDPGWASWRPSDDGATAAQEIANHVGPEYRLANGEQLAVVTGGDLKIAELPVHVALRSSSGAVSIVDGHTVLFTLCGGGLSCSIRTGKPSVARMLLLRREALELALYAFHDVDGVDNVVALLPPNSEAVAASLKAAGAKVSTAAKSATGAAAGSSSTATAAGAPVLGAAMLFRRDQLTTSLHQPLSTTLPPQTPDAATIERAPEAKLVDVVTGPSLFLPSIVQGQDASTFLVLDPPTAK